MDQAWAGAVGAVVTAIIGALGLAVREVMKLRHDQREYSNTAAEARRKNTLDEFRELLEMTRKDLNNEVTAHQGTRRELSELRDEHTTCLQIQERLQGHCDRLEERLEVLAQTLRDKGMEVPRWKGGTDVHRPLSSPEDIPERRVADRGHDPERRKR